MPPARPTVSVVLCAYTELRFDALREAVDSVRAQSHPALEVLLVIDHNEGLLARAQEAFGGVSVIANDGQPGDSASRTTGARNARGEVVAFLDDDARASPGWIDAIASHYDTPQVIGTGGPVNPRWLAEPPAWLPEEFYWVVSCSYRGLPTEVSPIRNPMGTNMSFRRSVIEQEGWFSQHITSVGASTRGCQETEFAIRASSRRPGSVVLFIPAASVDHVVPPARTTVAFFCSRCWGEGRSKALVALTVGTSAALASERAYTARVLPRGVLRGLVAAARGDAMGLARAAAIVAGLAITGAGYAYGRGAGLLGTLGRADADG